QAEDGIRDRNVTGVQTCALPISSNFGVRISTALICARSKFSRSAIVYSLLSVLQSLGCKLFSHAIYIEPQFACGQSPTNTNFFGFASLGGFCDLGHLLAWHPPDSVGIGN